MIRLLLRYAANLGLLGVLGISSGPGAVAQVHTTQDATGTIEGWISGEGGPDAAPLANAIVSVSSGDRHFTASSDSLGHYRVSGLEAGSWRVRASHVGHRVLSASVQVPPGGSVRLDLSLAWKPILLPTLLVRAPPVRPLSPGAGTNPRDLGEIALRALEGSPGMVEGGLAQVVKSLPGNDPSDPRDVLLMRGSAADLKLVLLDGAPVYAPFHMAGLVESFDPRTLGDASLFLGGAPSQFDGGLSYILDLRGRNPSRERLQGSAAADLMTARIFLEGPVTSSSGFLVSARALHDLGMPLLSGGSSPYGFGDLLARWEWGTDGEAGGYLSTFWNQESVRLDLPDETLDMVNQEPAFDNSGLLGGLAPVEAARWGNQAVAGGYRTPLGSTWAEVKVSASRYEAELPLGDSLPLFAESRSDRTRMTLDFSRPWGSGTVRFGANVDRLVSRYTAMALDSAQAGTVNHTGLEGSSGGAYVEGTRPLGDAVSVRFGGRLDRYQIDTGFRFAPRVSLTWMLTDDAALTLAAGRYHQYSNVTSTALEENIRPEDPEGSPDPVEPLELSVGTADHLVVSLDQILTPDLRLELEAFYKDFTDVTGSRDRALNASGVDLRVARDGTRVSGWLGYTLTWFWASDGIFESGNSPFSGRHLLSAGLSAGLSDRTGLRLRAAYGDGLPFTSVPLTSSQDVTTPDYVLGNRFMEVRGDQLLNSAPELTMGPDEGFLRLEVELFGHWSPTVSGRTMELRPYLRVLNALNRRDALFYHFDPWRDDGPEPLADLPLLPLLGLEWHF